MRPNNAGRLYGHAGSSEGPRTMLTDAFRMPRQWPTPYDEKAADELVERIGGLDPVSADLLHDPAVAAMIRSLGGNSPYLADLAIREFPSLRRLAAEGPGPVVDDALEAL